MAYVPRRSNREDEDGILSAIGNASMTGAEGLLALIDAPGQYIARPLLAGEYDKLFSEGTTSGELLDAYGMRPSEDALGGWGRPLAEFATGAIADPLNLLSFGGATAAKTALKGAGRIDDAVRIAGRNYLDDAVTKLGSADDYGKLSKFSRSGLQGLEQAGLVRGIRSADQLDNPGMWEKAFGQTPVKSVDNLDEFIDSAKQLTDEDLLARPIVGRRVSERRTTLDEIMNRLQTEGNTDALKAIRESAEGLGKNADNLRSQKLRNDIGIRLPFSDVDLIGAQLPGGEAFAGALDLLGQGLRWSRPGRGLAAAFDQNVMEQTEEGGQIIAKQLSKAAKEGEVKGKQEFLRTIADLDSSDIQGTDSSAVRSYIERGAAPGTTFSPQMQDFVDRVYPELREKMRQRRVDAGMSDSVLGDEAIDYFPRQATEGILSERALKGQAASSGRQVSTPDQIARKQPLVDIEGGTEALNTLSLETDPATGRRLFGGKNRLLQTDNEAGREIAQRLGIDDAKGVQIARTLHQLEDDILDEGVGIFNNHWTSDLENYVINNSRAFEVSDRMNQILARQARPEAAGDVVGGKAISMTDALENLGLRSFDEQVVAPIPGTVERGAGVRLAQEIEGLGKASGPTTRATLDSTAIKEAHVKQLRKINQVTAEPTVMQKLFEDVYDPIVNMWKASILARPARFFRDWLSGIFVNQTEVGNLSQTVRGYHAQHALMHGDWDTLAREMADAPRYSGRGLTQDQLVREIQNDVATSGIMEARRDIDLTARIRGAADGSQAINSLRPGDNPIATFGSNLMSGRGLTQDTAFDRHLYQPAKSDPTQFAKDFLSVGAPGQSQKNIKSPLFKWSAELGTTTDFINRGAGYFGLLMQGVDPMEAGRRMLAGHVDYSTLTNTEAWIRRFVPFYAYTSRIGRWVAGKIAENPGGRYTQMNLRLPQSFGSDEEGFKPQQLRHSYGFRITPESIDAMPFSDSIRSLLDLKEGEDLYLSDFDLPGVDTINLLSPEFKANGNISAGDTTMSLFSNALGMMNPLIQDSVEMATGVDTFTGKPIREWKPNSQRAADAVFGEDSTVGHLTRRVDPLLQFVPYLGHAFQTANYYNQAENPYSGLLRATMPNATGFKLKGISEQDVLSEKRRLIQKLVESDPRVRTFSKVFIPDAVKQGLSEDDILLRLLDYQNQIDADRKAAARQMGG
jgi:hypothetical protein